MTTPKAPAATQETAPMTPAQMTDLFQVIASSHGITHLSANGGTADALLPLVLAQVFDAIYQGYAGAAAAPQQAVPEGWHDLLTDLTKAMRAYEMAADDEPPYKHRQLMERATAMLAAAPAAAAPQQAVPDRLRTALSDLRMVLQMATPSIDKIHEFGPDGELEKAWQIFYDDVIPALAAAPVAAAAQQAVPDGYKLVPIEPTEEMHRAGARMAGITSYVWSAMLAAAPVAAIEQPKQVQQAHVMPPFAAPASQHSASTAAWISVTDRLPVGNCIASYLTAAGKRRTIVAFHAARFSIEAYGDDAYSEVNDADDKDYLMPGWYECIDNWGDFSSVFVNEGTVSHWMPLPVAPEFPQIACAARQGGVTCNDTPELRTQPPADSQNGGAA